MTYKVEKQYGVFVNIHPSGKNKRVTLHKLEDLVGSDQGKYLSLWSNSEKKRLLLDLEWEFGGRNRPIEF